MSNPTAAAAAAPLGSKRLTSAFHAVGLMVLVTAALYYGHAVLVPLALSALFAFVLSTPAEWVEKRGLGRVGGVLIVTAATFVLLGGIITVAVVEVRSLVAELPDYRTEIAAKTRPIEGVLHRFDKLKANVRTSAPPAATQAVTEATAKPLLVTMAPTGDSPLTLLPFAASALEQLVNAVLIVVLTIFLLIQRESFRDRLIRLAGRRRLSTTSRALADAAARVGKYLLLQLAVNAGLGTVIAGTLYLLGVPYALLWGLLVTVLRFVPYVGYWIAGVGAIAIAAASAPGWTHPLLVFGLFAAIDLTMANAVEPLLFSHGTGVSAVALLVAAIFWATLWGPVGLLLSTPLTVCLAVLGKHVPALGFLAILLGDEPSLDPSARFYNRLLARDYDEASVLLDTYAAGHPPEATYDEVILPALAQVKTDREQQDVSADEEKAVYDATTDLLNGLGAHGPPKPPPESATKRVEPVRVVGCAVFGTADDLALRMLAAAIAPVGGELVVTKPDGLVAAVKAAPHATGKPVVACLSTLSPGGLAQARALIADVRKLQPPVKILVGRWGQIGDTSRTEKYLRDSGATDIGWTLRETIGQLVPGPAEVKK